MRARRCPAPNDAWRPGSRSLDLAVSFLDWAPNPPDRSAGLWMPARIAWAPLGAPPLELGAPLASTRLRNESALVRFGVRVTNLSDKPVTFRLR